MADNERINGWNADLSSRISSDDAMENTPRRDQAPMRPTSAPYELSYVNATQATAPLESAASAAPTAPQASDASAGVSARTTAPVGNVAPGSASARTAQHAADRPSQSYVPSSTTVRSAQVPAATKGKKSGGGFKTFALGFLGAALAFALGTGIVSSFGLGGGVPIGSNAPAATEEKESTAVVTDSGEIVPGDAVTQVEDLAEAVAEKALPSVVAIDTYVDQASMAGGFWGYGSGQGQQGGGLTAYGLGSGVVISPDGFIITNYHVIEGADKVMVTVEGQEYEGTIAGTDPSSDLAVIKVEPTEELTAIEIGSSSNLKPGQWVMSLGSPFGLEQSVATGIVSAVSRTVVMGSSDYSYGGQSAAADIYANMIQTDAAINPGNSGGALVDQNGRLVGINSVIESYSGSYSGVGFAIPVDYAMNIAQQIMDGKTPTHAQIGVATTSVDSAIAERYGLSVDKGAYISKVYEESGASEAGLQPGDIITKVNDTRIDSSTDLVAAARAHTPGEVVNITFVRGSETQSVDVTLGSDENAELNTGGTGEQTMPFGNGQGGSGNMNMEDLFQYFGYGPDGQGNTPEGGQGFSLEDLFNYYYGQGSGQGQQGEAA